MNQTLPRPSGSCRFDYERRLLTRFEPPRQDLAADLAARLQLGADEVRVLLAGKEKGVEIGSLLEKAKFEESEQVEGAPETPTDCNQYSMCPLPELCNIPVSVAPRRCGRAPRWQGGKVTLQDLIPQRSDRAKIAAFLNTVASIKIASPGRMKHTVEQQRLAVISLVHMRLHRCHAPDCSGSR